MKILKSLLLGLCTFTLTSVYAQPILVGYNHDTSPIYAQATNFTKFNLNFPGGTPGQLVAALDKAVGASLNVIITPEDAETHLPAFKLKQICLPELFQTLRAVTTRAEYVEGLNDKGFTSSESVYLASEFYTFDQNANDTSLWYFHIDRPRTAVKPRGNVCRFFQLTHYLDLGYTVDDITTAAQTAWKMQGYDSMQMSYHKETSLLIVVGDAEKVKVLEDVLGQMYNWPKTTNAVKTTTLPLPKSLQ